MSSSLGGNPKVKRISNPRRKAQFALQPDRTARNKAKKLAKHFRRLGFFLPLPQHDFIGGDGALYPKDAVLAARALPIMAQRAAGLL